MKRPIVTEKQIEQARSVAGLLRFAAASVEGMADMGARANELPGELAGVLSRAKEAAQEVANDILFVLGTPMVVREPRSHRARRATKKRRAKR